MWFLTYLSYLAILVQVSFITIAIAAGLYYLAELVEEYSNQAKKYISWINVVVTILFILLWLCEDFPSHIIISGLLAQLCHFVILGSFPYVSLTSPAFISAVVLLVANHYFAFRLFGSVFYSFTEVLAYFTLCLWLVPFALFVSLSANDSVLPTTINGQMEGDIVTNYFMKKNRKYGLLTFFDFAKQSILPVRTKKIY